MLKYIGLFILIFFNINKNIYSQDFEVSPVIMEFTVDEGESQTKLLSVKNHSNFKTSFSVTFADFTVDVNGNKQIMKRNSSKNSCADWITIEKTFFEINPNEQINLKVTLESPAEDNTSRWAIMYIQTVKEQVSFDVDKSAIGAGINLSGRIAVHVFRKPVSDAKSDLTIKYLKENNSTDSIGRIFSAVIENKGQLIEKCKVTFIASDMTTAEEIRFDPIYLDSYPNCKRNVQFTLPKTMMPGKYELVALLDYGKATTIKGVRLKETLLVIDKKKEKE